jgi:outer membrane protein assembly factor BamB
MKRATILSIMVLGMLLAPLALAPGATAAGGPSDVDVLFDFGKGQWAWRSVPVPETPTAWCATVAAANWLSFELDYEVGPLGIYLKAVNGVAAPEDFSTYWTIWVWNATSGAWEFGSKGAISLPVSAGDAIAWQLAAGGDPAPAPTPRTRDPWLGFRGGGAVEGAASGDGPAAGGMFWAVNLSAGPIDATPVVADGLAFVVTGGVYDWGGSSWVGPPAVVALDATSGVEAWRRPFEGLYAFEISSPAYRGGVLYVSTAKGHVMALSAADGTVEWDVAVNASTGVAAPAVPGSPVLVGTADATLLRLSPAGGSVVWGANLSGAVYQAVPAVDGGRVYTGTEEGAVHCVALGNGTEVWNVTVGGRVRSTPLLAGGCIYLTAALYSGLSAVDGWLYCLDQAGNVVWNATVGPTGSSPALLGDLIVAGCSDGVKALRSDGIPAWAHTASGPVAASPVIASGRAYVLTNVNDGSAGRFSSVLAIAANGSLAWSRTLEPHQWAAGSIAMADGRAYAASDNGWVYCLGETPLEPRLVLAIDGVDVVFGCDCEGAGAAIVEWTLDPGDGSGVLRGTPSFSHEYRRSGLYNATLTVTDEYGRTASASRSFEVEVPEATDLGPVVVVVFLAVMVLMVVAILVAVGRARGR